MDKIIAIAINEYSSNEINNLKNCLNDVNSIVAILSELYEYDNLDITLYNKPEQTTLSFLYKSLNQEFNAALEDDTILIIYAGHGEFNPYLNTSYWYCADSNESDPTTWFNLRDLLDFFRASPAKHIALISDSCFSGAIFEERNRGGGIEALVKKKSRQALTSGGVEPVSDGKFENSPFNLVLQKVLKENINRELTFSQLCENTIKNFDYFEKQTPYYGSLFNVGHEGGTYLFKKRDISSKNIVQDINLSLDINPKIKIRNKLKIPFFQSNNKSDAMFINCFIQQLGYSIINDVRLYFAVKNEQEFYIQKSEAYGFEIIVDYIIKRNDEKYLSIELSRGEDFGTAHPNYFIYTINFTFNPTKKISLFDLIDTLDLKHTVCKWIDIYADDEIKEILKQYTEYEYLQDLNFSISDKELFLFFNNMLPHALQAGGFLSIPLDKVQLK